MLVRAGVTAALGVAGFIRALFEGDGEAERTPGSARRINWKGVKPPGDPPGDEAVLMDWGLVPFGVDN